MMKTIELKKVGSEFTSTPGCYLNGDFSLYLSTTKAAGCRYDAKLKLQRGSISSSLVPLISQLKQAGFTVALDEGLRNEVAGAVESVKRAKASRGEELNSIDGTLQARGVAMYDYQRDGVEWLLDRKSSGLIADDMGLGKTLQTIVSVPTNAAVLVICPAVVKRNWANEVTKLRGDLTPIVLSGRKNFRWPTAGEVVIVNFDILSGDVTGKYDKAELKGHGLPMKGTQLIIDEIHLLKNFRSKRSERVNAIAAMVRKSGGRTLGATGTPLVNRPMELWSVLSIFGLGFEAFQTWDNFIRIFGLIPGEYGGYDHAATAHPDIAACLDRVMIRRLKSVVLSQLPPKLYCNIPVELSKKDSKAFDALASEYGIDQGLLSLRDVPFELISKTQKAIGAAVIPAMLEVIEEYEANDTALVVFAKNRLPIDTLETREGWEVITGDTPHEVRQSIVNRFQRGELKGVGATIAAAGVGITLTHASHALFVQQDWTPAANVQAEDRIHRIGQIGSVLIKKLVVDHPLTNRVDELLAEKTALISSSIDAPRTTPVAAVASVDELLSGTTRVESEKPGDETPVLEVGIVDSLPETARYALRNLNDEHNDISFWRINVVIKGKWAGWIFVSQIIGGRAERRVGSVRPNGSPTSALANSIIHRVVKDPRGAAQLFGQEIGICACCGAQLTNEESRKAGVGPICAQKF